jgi:hypothetical protein
MLILSTKLWKSNHILKLYCSSVWDSPDVSIICDCVQMEIKRLFTEAKDTNRPAYLICDATKGEMPSFTISMKFAKFMVSIQDILNGGLECTIFYVKSETTKMWFQRLLDIYTPTRPIHMVNDKRDIKKYIY